MIRSELKAQIRQIIESVRNNSENPQQPRVIFYRALTGTGRTVGERWMFEGIDDGQLVTEGIFASNRSHVQLYRRIGLFESWDRRVPGLPVFATLEETRDFIKGKEFSAEPSIAALDLPLSAISSSDRIAILMRHTRGAAVDDWGDSLSVGSDRQVIVDSCTFDDPIVDWEVPYTRLLQHAKTGHAISGVCYLKGTNSSDFNVPEEIRKYEVLIQPRALSHKGLVIWGRGFELFSHPVT